MKWPNSEIVIFLDIFRNFEVLWNTSRHRITAIKMPRKQNGVGLVLDDVFKKNLKPDRKLVITGIKSIKLENLSKSGVSADEVYQPKLTLVAA